VETPVAGASSSTIDLRPRNGDSSTEAISTQRPKRIVGQRVDENDVARRVDRIAGDAPSSVSHMAFDLGLRAREHLFSKGTSRWRSTLSPEVLYGDAPSSNLFAAVGDRL
jgi:hypothetical protein